MRDLSGSFWTVLAVCALWIAAGIMPAAARETNGDQNITLSFGGTATIMDDSEDDDDKFREVTQIYDGLQFGIQDYSGEWSGDGWSLETSAQLLHPGDYNALARLTREGLGFVQFDYDEFDTYDDDSNLYYGFAPFSYDTDKDLIKTWRTTGLTFGWTPTDLPQVTFRIERWEKFGDRSRVIGGGVTDGTVQLQRYPVVEDLDQARDRFSLTVTDTFGNFDVTFRQRYEEFDGRNEMVIQNWDDMGMRDDFAVIDYIPENRRWATDFSARGDILTDILSLELTGNYTDIETYTTYDEETFAPDGSPTALGFDHNYVDNDHDGGARYLTLNSQLTWTPTPVWTFFGGLGYNNKQSEHDSIANIDAPHSGFFGPPAAAPSYYTPDGIVDRRLFFQTDQTRNTWMYNLGGQVRPADWITGRAGARIERGSVVYDWNEMELLDFGGAAPDDFIFWESDADFDKYEYNASLTLRPIRQLKLTGRYDKSVADYNYTDEQDINSDGTGAVTYPGFIDDTDRDTDEWAAIVEYHPISTVWTTYKFRRRSTDFIRRDDPISKNQMAESRSSIHSLAVNFTPVDGLMISGFGSHRIYEVKTDARNQTAPELVAEQYDGDSNTFGLNASYNLTQDTTLTAGGSHTYGDGEREHNFGNVFLGASHQLTDTWSIQGRYGYHFFDEDDNGNIDDYRAHVVSVGLTASF